MRTTFTITALLAIAFSASAQSDSTEVETEKKKNTSISVGVSSKKGGYAKLETEGDTTKKPEPFKIETKRKIITITTEPKPFGSVQDSVEDRRAELRKERRKMFTYWSGLDLGVNTLLGEDGDADLSGDADFMEINNARSRFFAINFHEAKLEFGSHHAGLMTGLGLEFTSYHLKNNVLLQYNADSVYALQVEKPEFRKNKLRQIGLRLPLMLEFNTKRAPIPTEEQLRSGQSFEFDRKGNVHLAAGLVGSWYFNTMYKQKYRDEDGQMRKEKDNGDYLLMPYRVAASVRVGYGGWNFFAEYALTPFFKEDKGPELTAFNVGLTLVGFN
jgi:hypothetical protein